MSAMQKSMEIERAQFASDAKMNPALQALRSGGATSTLPVCDVCQKKMYPTDKTNIDGFALHVKPCGQCARVGPNGLKCSNLAHRVVMDDDNEILPLCNVHYKQRATQVGLHGSAD